METKGSCVLHSRLRLSKARVREAPARDLLTNPIEEDIDHRRGVKRQYLAEHEAADHSDSKRMPQFGAEPAAHRQRDACQHSRQSRHQDGTESQQASL